MNEYYFNVYFQNGKIDTDLEYLVQNDYNSTKLKFTFDKEGRVLFKLLYPDGETKYVNEIVDNEIILGKGILSHHGDYEIEISLYTEDGKLTDYAIKTIHVRNEIVSTDEIVEADDRVPILDKLINDVNESLEETNNINIDAEKIDNTATITITKKDGTNKTVEVYDGEKGDSGIVSFSINNEGHLIAESESASNYESYTIDNTNGHLYLEIGE